ncbi:MAG: DivIVA domain-containing protein, partial [Calditrichaeota bacterium]|nr:DivIVA domain-containing protein [Calditrichota bacterium]
MRGFDPIEVQTFLEMVSEQYEELVEENKRQSRQVIELQAKLE